MTGIMILTAAPFLPNFLVLSTHLPEINQPKALVTSNVCLITNIPVKRISIWPEQNELQWSMMDEEV